MLNDWDKYRLVKAFNEDLEIQDLLKAIVKKIIEQRKVKCMNFEEQFPSITFMNCKGSTKGIGLGEKFIEGSHCEICHLNHTMTFEYAKLMLMNNCLDKQRVKEALAKHQFRYGAANISELIKELGLEKEM